MKLITLSCPSCGGELEPFDDLMTARCKHCGKKVLLEGGHVAKERQEIAKLMPLCEAAIEAGKYDKLEEYAEQITVIDESHPEGWLKMAIAEYGRATYGNTRYRAVKTYLSRAVKWGGEREAYDVQQEWGGKLFGKWLGKATELRQTASNCYRTHNAEAGSQKCLESMQYAIAAVEIAPDEDRAYGALVLMAGLVQLAPALWQSPPAQLIALEPLRIKRRLKKELRNWRRIRNRVESMRRQIRQRPNLPASLQTVSDFVAGFLIRKSADVWRRIRQQDAVLKEQGEKLGLPWLAVRTDSPGKRGEDA